MRILFIATLATSSLFMGCSERFLDRHSLTQLAADNFWQNEKDALLAINGIYDVLQARVLYSGNLNGPAGIPMHDSFTDNSFNNWKWEGPGNYVEGNVSASTGGMFEDFWLANFRGIVRSNEAIANLAKMTGEQIEEPMRENLTGQALFLRALFYFNLAVYYEDVPLITEPQTLEIAQTPKASQRAILDQVIADLQNASTLLPPVQPAERFGHATRGAALGLLARAFLYDGQWNNAAEAAQRVIDLQQYNLNHPFTTQFTESGETSGDVIFAARFLDAPGFSTGETFSATYVGQPKVDKQPMPNLAADFYCIDGRPISTSPLYNPANPKENRDPRLSATILFKGDVYIEDEVKSFTGNNVTGYGPKTYLRKRTSEVGTSPAAECYCIGGRPISTPPLDHPAKPKEHRDPRLSATILFKGDVYIEDEVKSFNGNSVTGYGLKKYLRKRTSEVGTSPAQPGGQDFYILRYADVLLMRAEALIESGQTGEAVY